MELRKKNQVRQRKEIKKEESHLDPEKSLEIPPIKKNEIDQPRKTEKLRVVPNETRFRFQTQLSSKMPEPNQSQLRETISEVDRCHQRILLS